MLKVGLVGTGFIATQKHLPAWRRVGDLAKVIVLCDADRERGRKVASQFRLPAAYEDFQTMLDKERPDIVDICTPPRTHSVLAVQALRAGAHVLIEKPMAVSLEECDAILAAATETGRKVCVGHSDLFYPAFIKARKLVQQGEIGEFRGMRILLSTPVGYMTSKADHWSHQLPGGVIGESGPHVVYLTLAFIRLICDIRIHAYKVLKEFPWSQYEDYRLDLVGEKAVSTVTLVYATNQWAAQMEIWGDNGFLQLDLESQALVRYNRRELTPAAIGLSASSRAAQIAGSLIGMTTRFVMGSFQSTHDRLIREFCKSIRNGTEPPVTAQEGREAVRVMKMIVERLQQAKA